jgi:hypothetical protein
MNQTVPGSSRESRHRFVFLTPALEGDVVSKMKNRTRRAALVGGGGLLLWWLLGRGSAWARGRNVARERRGCRLRLSADGLTVNGARSDIAGAVAACDRHKRADLVVTGGARWGDHRALVEALYQAGIRPVGSAS